MSHQSNIHFNTHKEGLDLEYLLEYGMNMGNV